jgi:hypothetical protein
MSTGTVRATVAATDATTRTDVEPTVRRVETPLTSARGGGADVRKATAWLAATTRRPTGQVETIARVRPDATLPTVTSRVNGAPGFTTALRTPLEVWARPPPPSSGMQPIAGLNAVAAPPRVAERAVKTSARRVVTPGATGLPLSPRTLTSMPRSVTLLSTPPTT